jgi:drug/metabolite transporter (DMT)-like permease
MNLDAPPPWVGDAMALGCAVVWALAVLLFRRLDGVRPVALNLFKNAVAVMLLGITMVSLGVRFDFHRSATDWVCLIGSGVLGLAVADSLFLSGLRRVEGSVAAVADCAFAPTVIVLSTLWLHEVPRSGFLLGAPLVLLGLVVVVWQPVGGKKIDRGGLALVLSGVCTTAVGVVLAKPALTRSSLVEATTVRLIAGTVALLLFEVLQSRGREALALFKPQPAWRFAIPATVLATYISMLLWLGGMKYGSASRASLLNQTAAIFIMVFSWLSGEHIPVRRWLGATMAMLGVLVIVSR